MAELYHPTAFIPNEQRQNLYIQGRWFCHTCQRMYTGCIPADQLEVRHTCGAVMTRTPSLWEGD